MNRASSATGWVRNPTMKSPDLDPTQASSYELGWTFNPLTGCLNHNNGLCKGGNFPCYAYKLANGRLRQRYLANENVAPSQLGKIIHAANEIYDPFYPRFWQDRVREQFGACTSGAEAKGIFVCDMGDLFGIGVPEAWTRQVLNHISMSWYREHRFYLLTKQPQNLVKFSPFPPNCWVGVTATGFQAFASAHYHLARIEAKIKFLSFEPLLYWGAGASPQLYQEFSRHLKECCDWLIIGAQTKPYKPPKIEWVEEIESAARQAGIPYFEKDNLKPLIIDQPRIPEWSSTKTGLRQEMPQG